MTVRVVLADDHPMYRFGLRAVLDASPEVDVVGEAANGAELLAQVARCSPDVVLTDLSMPTLSGTAAIDELTRRRPGLGILVLTMHEDDASLLGALRAGARGYLLKGADRDEIVRAVLAVAGGDALYGGAVARRVADALTGTATRTPAFPELTGREREVLELLAAGLPTGQIARRLGLSDKTVRNHVSAVLTKLQVPDRAAAVSRAREAGMGTPGHGR
ncbi:DNA-binding NarL/FixJ family response regulator [Geodermatophilus bullaregiensis]|uniref:response regulator transcription factor n=1 Tax=Geodermatophilus bullaregiensis TaxID=1564160 RepID=UPI0027DDD67E|nr:response regulator transcription factor [Geodermatophilus bullaregiensis]MBM7807894.1 DNA-binding NarL/FixJ family response regulator [Geodermatophilus bullaregiensis]